MTSDVTTLLRQIHGQDARHAIFTKSNCPWRFLNFKEHSDWGDVIFDHEEMIEGLCIGVMIVAALYFITVALATLFLR